MSSQALLVPAEKCFVVDACSLAPFLERQFQALVLDPYRNSAIAVLLFFCCPVAVLWIISLVVVQAIHRVSGRWTRPHVGKEVLKLHPALANADSTPAVVRKVCRFWIGAPGKHPAPNAVFACPAHRMCSLVRAVSFGKLLSTYAPARQALASQQVRRPERLSRAASAETFPHRAAPRVVRCAAGDGKAAKALSSEVERFVHANTVLRKAGVLELLTKVSA